MIDTLTKAERSERMGRVRGRDTRAEWIVRRLVHGLGYRYRLHGRDLPGKPDLVLRARRKVIFVHGCFWHRHDCKLGRRLPKSNLDFWLPKLSANHERDIKNLAELQRREWDALVIWECELRDKDALARRVIAFLEGKNYEVD